VSALPLKNDLCNRWHDTTAFILVRHVTEGAYCAPSLLIVALSCTSTRRPARLGASPSGWRMTELGRRGRGRLGQTSEPSPPPASREVEAWA